METTTPAQAEEPTRPADLRVELFQDLLQRFAAALSSNGSLPVAAQEALVELLNSDAPTAAEIAAAASKNDPVKEEAGDE
jgi:hypothetical protein